MSLFAKKPKVEDELASMGFIISIKFTALYPVRVFFR